jgi:hypothetical protein
MRFDIVSRADVAEPAATVGSDSSGHSGGSHVF